MPLYEYQCVKCGERVEIIQRVSDPPYTHCPKCTGEMRKLHSAPAIRFKGSGFYKTDYAAKKQSGGESKGAETKGDSKTETKSDSSTTKPSD